MKLEKFFLKPNIFIRYWINLRTHFIKKEKDIWVFGAIQGEKYIDNAKYLFEYINYNTDITAVWLTNNDNVIDELRSEKLLAFRMHSKEGIFYALRASAAIFTHRGNYGLADLPFYAFSKKTNIIQLWHGMPIKKIAFDDKIFGFRDDENSFQDKIKRFIIKSIFPYNKFVDHPDLIIALSNENQKIFSGAFRVPYKNIAITGYPRNDVLFKNNNCKVRKIIYAPTFRGELGASFDLFLEYGFNVAAMDKFLSENAAELYIKLHPYNKPSEILTEKIELSSNINFFVEDDIYRKLGEFDILVTDYSSIYFDFLLTDKPIVFAPFDKESYMKVDREFYFNYEDVTPGPKAYNWNEVMIYIERFIQSPELYLQERNIIKNIFHTYQDANSAKRVYDKILTLVNEQCAGKV